MLFRNLGFIYLMTYEQQKSNTYFYETIHFSTPRICFLRRFKGK